MARRGNRTNVIVTCTFDGHAYAWRLLWDDKVLEIAAQSTVPTPESSYSGPVWNRTADKACRSGLRAAGVQEPVRFDLRRIRRQLKQKVACG